MEFTDVLRRRRMIRGFSAEALPEGTADRLLAAAVRAPSAGFSQGFSFLVLEDEEQRAPSGGSSTRRRTGWTTPACARSSTRSPSHRW
jgi:hypothetical protein